MNSIKTDASMPELSQPATEVHINTLLEELTYEAFYWETMYREVTRDSGIVPEEDK